ncbi:AbrB family transcriptional regulator [Gordonia sinesedis]
MLTARPNLDYAGLRIGVLRWMVCLSGTAILGFCLAAVGAPAAWLIAALVMAAATTLTSGRQFAPTRHLLRPAQGVIGVMAAAPLAFVSGGDLARHLGVSGVIVAFTVVLCLGGAYLLWRRAGDLGPSTAVLSTLAGGASGIATMAPELEVDHRYVAMSQYLRLVIVTLTLPGLLMLFGDNGGSAGIGGHGLTGLTALVLVGLVVVSGHLGARLHIPAPFLLTPLALTVLLGVLGDPSWMPEPTGIVANAAYAVIGWQAGGSFSRDSVRRFTRLLPVTLTLIAVTIGGCLVLAVGLARFASMSLVDAYLATTPGGIYAALAAAQSAGAGPVVTTAQVLRLLAMLITAVVCAKYFARRATRASTTPPLGQPLPAYHMR